MEQLALELDTISEELKIVSNLQDYTSTFAGNMSLPIHRWFRYTAGFSAMWVDDLIKREIANGRTKIMDPFAGSGTVMLQSELNNVKSIGIEAHPYVYNVAKAKLSWRYNSKSFFDRAEDLLRKAKSYKGTELNHVPKLLGQCYSQDVLAELLSLKRAYYELEETDDILKNLMWFLITAILRISSHVGTAQWQYILPNKRKAKSLRPFTAFTQKMQEVYNDIVFLQKKYKLTEKSIILNEDIRTSSIIEKGWADLIITSPPYANNYDYADALRLEMTFWGDINDWGDLQKNVRSKLVRACTQHVSKLGDVVEEIIEDPKLSVIKADLKDVYSKLAEERKHHGGKKNYHFMVAAYFKDLADTFHTLRLATTSDALVCFVVGDSAPYGVYVPVDKWLGDIAVSAGFSSYSFEKLRDRNVKWKNRKHTVPLHEGRLWING